MDGAMKDVRGSLRSSLREGLFASAMTGLTQEYLAPFLIFLEASTRQIGLLTAVPNLAAAIVQLRSAEITERVGSRTRTLSLFVLLQAAVLAPMAGIALAGGRFVAAFIALATLFTVFGAVATPAWGSLLSELVPEKRRGDFFGLRARVMAAATMAATLLAGLIVHLSRSHREAAGFFLVFALAGLARLVSWGFLRKLSEPPDAPSPAAPLPFSGFLRGMRERGYPRYVAAVSLMSFAVNLAGPYFAVLMLRDLGFGYPLYAGILVAAGVATVLSIRRWGRHADRVGNIRIVRSTTRLICLLPLLWIASRAPLFLVAVQVLSGFLWAGFNLAAANFVYDAVPAASRTRGIAYFNVINGLALFAGALCGGLLADRLPPLHGSPILTLFALSAVARAAVYALMIHPLEEVREVPRVRSAELFVSMIGVRPLLGLERKTLRY